MRSDERLVDDMRIPVEKGREFKEVEMGGAEWVFVI